MHHQLETFKIPSCHVRFKALNGTCFLTDQTTDKGISQAITFHWGLIFFRMRIIFVSIYVLLGVKNGNRWINPFRNATLKILNQRKLFQNVKFRGEIAKCMKTRHKLIVLHQFYFYKIWNLTNSVTILSYYERIYRRYLIINNIQN